MPDVHAPWIGEYWDVTPQRVLLLGESHYLTELSDDSPELTRNIVRDVRDGRRFIAFYARTEALVRSAAPFLETSTAFWDRVAFLNFVPVTVGSTFNAVPTTEMWTAGAKRLLEILEELKPTHVLSLGQRQWNHIAFGEGWSSQLVEGQTHIRYWNAPTGHGSLATWVNHPSSRGFSVAKWQARVEALFRCGVNHAPASPGV